MPDISPVGHGPVGPLDRVSSSSSASSPSARFDKSGSSAPSPPARLEPAPERPGDRVELSSHARYLDRIRHLPGARLDRVDQVRDAIARGEYETEEKLRSAIDRILEDLFD